MTETTSRTGTELGQRAGGGDPARHAEGPVARGIEEYTARLPSDLFLWAAGGSILASLAFKVAGRDQTAVFVGQWVAPFMLLGVYNKIV